MIFSISLIPTTWRSLLLMATMCQREATRCKIEHCLRAHSTGAGTSIGLGLFLSFLAGRGWQFFATFSLLVRRRGCDAQHGGPQALCGVCRSIRHWTQRYSDGHDRERTAI